MNHLSKTLPDRFSAKSGAKNRVGRIFIDYLRNGRGATTVSAWSARVRPGLGISVPVRWEELPKLKSGSQWTVKTVHTRLDETVALWRQMWASPGGGGSFRGSLLRFEQLPAMTAPARPGGPPVWLGGASESALRRIGRRYDGWMPYPPAAAEYARGLATVREAAAAAGRDAGAVTPALFVSVAVTDTVEQGRELLGTFARANYGMPLDQLERIQALVAGPLDVVAEKLRGYVAAGARHLAVRIAATSLETQREQLKQIVKLKGSLS